MMPQINHMINGANLFKKELKKKKFDVLYKKKSSIKFINLIFKNFNASTKRLI
jgi:hypothetical protein